MLDEKGRLFGKINIVDLLIVIVIIAAIAFVGIKFVMPSTEAAPTQTVVMTIHVDETHDYVVDALEKGSAVYNVTDSISFGTCVDFSSAQYYEAIDADETKTPVLAAVEGKCTADITIEVEGTLGTYGATINGSSMGIGHALVLNVGHCQVYGSIKSLAVK